MKQLSDVGDNGFKLSLEAGSTTRWRSPGGVIFDADNAMLNNSQTEITGHRLTHLLDHSRPNPLKNTHSVFSVPRHQVTSLIDEAFNIPVSNRLQAYRNGTVDAEAFIVDMGRQIGTAGETHIRVVKIGNPSGRIIRTAYPTIP